jgi:hypothetical protein
MRIIKVEQGGREVERVIGYALLLDLCNRATSQRSYEVETSRGALRIYKTIDRANGDYYYHVYFNRKPLHVRIMQSIRRCQYV